MSRSRRVRARPGLFAAPRAGGRTWEWARFALLLLPIIPAAGFAGAALYQSVIDGIDATPALAVAVLVILLGLLAPQLHLIARLGRLLLPAAATLAGVALLVAGGMASGYSATQPRPDNLLYILNADTGAAFWATADRRLDEWTGQFLAGGGLRTQNELLGNGIPDMLLSSEAPGAPLAPSELTLIGQETTGDVRTLQVRLSSPRPVGQVYLFPASGTQILAAGLDGREPQEMRVPMLRVSGLSAEGIDLTLRVRAEGPAQFRVLDVTPGLPEIPGVQLPEKPDWVMSAPVPDAMRGYPTGVHTLVRFD
jgi:hypothetical protein